MEIRSKRENKNKSLENEDYTLMNISKHDKCGYDMLKRYNNNSYS